MMTSATELKEQGNKYYLAKKYADAIASYSKAITKNNSVPTFYTNRALCYLKLKKWDEAVKDCKRALDLDNNAVKGHYFLGEAYMELNMFDESINNLSKAFDLAKEQKLNFGDDITSALRKAKRKRFLAQEEKRIQEEIELQSYLNRLILEDKERRMSAAQANADKEKAEHECDNKMAELADMFKQLDERRKTRDVPDYLCGRISFELMKEPVITPSGITYDRKDIEEHLHVELMINLKDYHDFTAGMVFLEQMLLLNTDHTLVCGQEGLLKHGDASNNQRVGHFDPVTRAELTADKLIPNLAMKEVVDNYLQENPWAEEY